MNRNLTSLALTLACALIAVADEPAVLFKNVMVFDGKSDKLSGPTSVLVVGNKIATIGTDLVSLGKASVIDGGGGHSYPVLLMRTPTLRWPLST